MFKNHNELIEATLEAGNLPGAPMTEVANDFNALQRELTYLKSNISDLEQGNWIVTAKKLHAEAAKRAQSVLRMVKALRVESKAEGLEEAGGDAKKAKRAVDLMSQGFDEFSRGYSKMSQGFLMARGTGVVDAAGGTYMRKALDKGKDARDDADVAVDRFQELFGRFYSEAKTEASAAPEMYRSWLLKVHDAISDAYPNLSMWETTPAEKKATQALRGVLVVVKRALGR